MYSLKHIIEQNQKAEAAGIIEPGSAVGTTGYRPGTAHPAFTPGDSAVNKGWEVGGTPVQPHAGEGGLRGHSIGADYPFSVTAGEVDESTTWTVVNLATHEVFNSYRGQAGSGACARAHAEARARKAGVPVQVLPGTIVCIGEG